MAAYVIRYYDDGNVRYNKDLFGGALQEADSPAAALRALSTIELRPGQHVDVREWAVEVNRPNCAVIGHSNYPGQTVVAELP